MRSRFLAATLGLTLAALPAGTAAAAARKPDVVSLRFAWPAKLEAQVTSVTTRARTGTEPTRSTLSCVQTTVRDGERHRTTVRDVTVDGPLPLPPGFEVTREEYARATEAIAEVVTAEGAFLALEGTEPVRALLERALAAAKAPKEQVARGVQAAEVAMRSESEELWNLGVGFWNGGDLEVGERYGLENEAELPLVPGKVVKFRLEFGVVRRVPCAAGEKAPRCVEITLRSVPDPDAMPGIVKAVAARMTPAGAPALPEDAIQEVAIENALLLVTEPATLVPHRLVWTKSTRVTGQQHGEATASEQVDRREYTYRYAAAAAPAKKAIPKKKTAPKKRAAPKPPAGGGTPSGAAQG